MRLPDRISSDPVPYAIRVLALLVVFVVLLFFVGCASDRYLTVEEDAAMRERCEASGCVTVPMPIWKQIEQLLRMMTGA